MQLSIILLSIADFDECKYSSGTFCHNHATCTNLPLEFTFRCDCNYGYTGNGTSCVAKRISQNDKGKNDFVVIPFSDWLILTPV